MSVAPFASEHPWIDFDYWPIILVRLGGDPSAHPQIFSSYLEEWDRFGPMVEEPFGVVFDLRHVRLRPGSITAEQRRLYSEMLKRNEADIEQWHSATALATPDARVAPVLINALLWVAGLRMSTRVFANLNEAMAWAAHAVVQRGGHSPLRPSARRP